MPMKPARLLATTALAVLLAGPAPAQDADRQALAQEYVDLPAVTSMMDSMFDPDTIIAQIKTAQPALNKLPYDKLRKIADIVSAELDSVRPDLTEAMRDKAAEHFTSDDLEALIAFYGSPAGASVLAKTQPFMQDVMTEIAPVMQASMGRMMQQLTQQLGSK
jgi:hypothetical protein